MRGNGREGEREKESERKIARERDTHTQNERGNEWKMGCHSM